jgi:NADP-dependent aldehyde dehydrogenase
VTATSTSTAAAAAEGALAAAPLLASQDLGARARMLQTIADALDDGQDELVDLAARESGLGIERLAGEVARTSGQLRLFAQVVREGSWLEATIERADPNATPPRPDLRRLLLPIGPVAVYSASNFPFAFSVAGGDTASALAAGCPVVVKAHSGHPALSDRTGAVIADALSQVGAPCGTVSVVHGQAEGRDLVQHPAIKAGAFTGSLYAGRLLYDLANARPDPIPFYGELGSINPVIIGAERAEESAADLAAGLIGSFTLGQGQFCTKPGLVFIPSSSAVLDRLAAGLATEAGPMLTPSIARAFERGIDEIGAVTGVRVVAQGRTTRSTDRVPSVPATIFATDVPTALAHRDVLFEECFGPTTLIVEYSDIGQLGTALQMLPGALTATVHGTSNDLESLAEVIDVLRARVGRLLFGGWPTGVAVTWSMQHGGPWPATTNPLFTSVGATAVRRFLRPITYQDAPDAVLPAAVRDGNPWSIPRRIDGVLQLPRH